MRLKVKDVDIASGGVNIVIINTKDAATLDLHPEDRVLVKKGHKDAICVIDIAESKKAVPVGSIGLFEEVLHALNAKDGDPVEIFLEDKPESLHHIKRKLDGAELEPVEIEHVIRDVVANKLTDTELTYFVSAVYTRGMSMRETVALTNAMINTGGKLEIKKKPVLELHSIGGVPGNRTTMVVVPILVAAGLTVPKTSSRAITSPSGTADTVEVLAPVSLPIPELKKIIDTVGGFMVWGGAVNLAPADDRIIAIEHPLSIDPEPQLLASIIAKQGSVSASHVLIEIPIGNGTKIKDRKEAKHLENQFIKIGSELGMRFKAAVTDGTQPIGNGIGPALEARDVLWLLTGDPRGPHDLRDRSLLLAVEALELAGIRNARKIAVEILDSGKAYDKFIEIIKAQGGKMMGADEIKVGEFMQDVVADKSGKVKRIDNFSISKIARIAGAPLDKGSGIYLYKHVGDKVKKGERLFTIYAENKEKLGFSVQISKKNQAFFV